MSCPCGGGPEVHMIHTGTARERRRERHRDDATAMRNRSHPKRLPWVPPCFSIIAMVIVFESTRT